MSGDLFNPNPVDRAVVASVDGMAGPEAYSVLAPIGCWPPLLSPLLVKEVKVEPGDGRNFDIQLVFTNY